MSVTVDICGYDKAKVSGGPVVWLMRFPAVLREQGIHVRVRLLSWHDPRDGVVFQCLQEQGFDVAGKEFADTESKVRWLNKQIAESPPDVFVPNLVTPAFFAARWARQAGIPTVGVLHSDDEFYRAIQAEFVFGQRRYALSSIVCVSRELERQVASRKPGRTEAVRIPYGVPTPDLVVKRPTGSLRLGFVGRFVEEQKRISEVARAFCRVVSEVPGTEAVMYGDGPDKRTVDYILATHGSGLPVSLGGNVPSEQIQQYLVDRCDVIVLLSDYEGLPISLLEAMACGVVPVCLNVRSGIPELIQDGVTGLLVDDRGDAFVAAIRRLKDDQQLWQRLSTAARKQTRGENSLKVSAQKWAEHLHSLHRRSGARKQIRMPARLDLPPVNPGLARQDQRAAGVPASLYSRMRLRAQSIMRWLAGISARSPS